MSKQFVQGQRFSFKRYSKETGLLTDSGFLLMPNEVTEFHSLLERGLDYDYAFERITGRPIYDENGQRQLLDIVLVVETIQLNAKRYANLKGNE